jgi:8-oxo-dGTP pyrophosphatase MutT (NUDIX family)
MLPGGQVRCNVPVRPGQAAPAHPAPPPDPVPLEDDLIRTVSALLSGRPQPPEPEWPHGAPRAAVALVLRAAPPATELLLIRRATRAGDPWSGHVALPGGRAQPEDADAVATAVRETHEEVGIDLATAGRWVGALPPVHPLTGAPRVVVRPYVFAVEAGTRALPNDEVAEAAWIAAEELLAPAAAAEHLHEAEEGVSLRFPALSARGFVVWGLTHRILLDFLEVYARARPGA